MMRTPLMQARKRDVVIKLGAATGAASGPYPRETPAGLRSFPAQHTPPLRSAPPACPPAPFDFLFFSPWSTIIVRNKNWPTRSTRCQSSSSRCRFSPPPRRRLVRQPPAFPPTCHASPPSTTQESRRLARAHANSSLYNSAYSEHIFSRKSKINVRALRASRQQPRSLLTILALQTPFSLARAHFRPALVARIRAAVERAAPH